MLIDKLFSKFKDEILFVKLNNDGFDLGAQRQPKKGSEIPEIVRIVKKYHADLDPQIADDEILQHPLVTIAPKEQIAEQDYVLVGERYLSNSMPEGTYKMVSLGDKSLFRVESGGTPSSNIPEYWDGNIRWATLVDLPAANLITELKDTERTISPLGLEKSSAKLLPSGTVLVSTRATIGRVAIAECETATNQGFKNIIVIDDTKVSNRFVAYMMTALADRMVSLASGGTFKEISKSNFLTLSIPLPPLEKQEQIVAELDGYQKIVDGAQQIIDAYKPTIGIDPTWEKVKLGDICNLTYGYTDTAKESGSARFVRITDIDEKGLLRDENKRYVDLIEQNNAFLLHRGDLLVARTGATYGKTLYFDTDETAVFASFLIKLDLPEYIDHYFYWIFAQTQNYWDQANRLVSGGAQPQFNANAIKQLVIPIPPLDVQKSIVKQAREEQKIIDANKKLISIFKQKITDKISEVWGE